MLHKKIIFTIVIVVAFFINLSAGEKVLNRAEFSFPNTAPTLKIRATKVFDSSNGTIKIKYDQNYVTGDVEKLRKIEEEYFIKKFGAIKGKLRDELSSYSDNDSVDVVICAKVPQIPYLDKTKYSKSELIDNSIKRMKQKPVRSIRSIIQNDKIIVKKIDKESDASIEGKFTIKALKKIAFNNAITSICQRIKKEPCVAAAPLSSAATTSAYNPSPLPSGSGGQGVNVATYEYGIWRNYHDYFPVQNGRWYYDKYINHFDARGLNPAQVVISNVHSWHSQVMFSLLWYAAPQANFYHYGNIGFGRSHSDPEASYMVSNGLQTLSCSYSNSTDANYVEMLLIDDFAYTYPYPVFCNPAGNYAPQGDVVNWNCYNAISAGASQHQNLNHYVWAEFSNYANPPALIPGTSADREMPYVLAPGMPPWYTYDSPYDFHCFDGAWTCPVGWDYEAAFQTPLNSGWQGTSLSAPITNGIAADVISANPNMVSWPEKVRAVLMLTAQNCDGGEWNCGIDGKDGAGVISGTNAVLFAKNHTSVAPNGSAVQDGLSAGTWYSTDVMEKRFNILIPNSKPANKHLRVVLTWDTDPELEEGINYLSDLDLVASTYGGYLESYSYNGNVEIVDIPSGGLTEGSTIHATINPTVLRFSTIPNHKDYFYYAIGWTWVADHAQ